MALSSSITEAQEGHARVARLDCNANAAASPQRASGRPRARLHAWHTHATASVSVAVSSREMRKRRRSSSSRTASIACDTPSRPHQHFSPSAPDSGGPAPGLPLSGGHTTECQSRSFINRHAVTCRKSRRKPHRHHHRNVSKRSTKSLRKSASSAAWWNVPNNDQPVAIASTWSALKMVEFSDGHVRTRPDTLR